VAALGFIGASMAFSQATATARPAVAAASGPSWRIVRGAALSPNNVLNGLAVVNKTLAWAVGSQGFSSNGVRPGRPVIERWNGSRWSAARLPSTWKGGLSDVAASSATSAWALGQDVSGTRQHLLHWNGRVWQDARFPGPQGVFGGNLGLTAAPRDHAWLITSPSNVASAQIFGRVRGRWRQQRYTCPSGMCNLYQIRARTAGDAWAVGNYSTGLTGGPLALHWTGSAWRVTHLPYVQNGYLTGVFGASATSAWAVGAVFQSSQMLLYRWNGTAWRQVQVPVALTAPNLGELTGITGDARGHLWIYDFGPQTAGVAQYLHYSGGKWSVVQGAVIAGQTQVTVRAVATVPGTSAAWSVGLGFVPTVNARARIERYGRI
jgi:hypothetical protein